MSRLKEWIDAMLGQRQAHDDAESRVILDTHEQQTATRLSRLTGKRRDEVLREAYRKADKILSERR